MQAELKQYFELNAQLTSLPAPTHIIKDYLICFVSQSTVNMQEG